MDKLEGTCIFHLYQCYATNYSLSELTMWSHLHTMSPPPPRTVVASDVTSKAKSSFVAGAGSKPVYWVL